MTKNNMGAGSADGELGMRDVQLLVKVENGCRYR